MSASKIRRSQRKTPVTPKRPVANEGGYVPRSRGQLARIVSQSFNGHRNMYDALGYPSEVTLDMYAGTYARNGVARRIVSAAPKDTWKDSFKIVPRGAEFEETKKKRAMTQDPKAVAFSKRFQQLDDQHKITALLCRSDILAGIGYFGILVLGFDDGKPLTAPLQQGSAKELLYVQPYSNPYVSVSAWDIDMQSPRYGLPVMYQVMQDSTVFGRSGSFQVHYSRVVHIAEDKQESAIFGTPRLQAVYNDVQDLLKVCGGSAEMYWRNADPKLVMTTGKDSSVDIADEDDLRDKMDAFENNLRRWIIANGMDIKALSPSLVDPEPHASIHFKLISAGTGIPLRILTGSERGELASTQDKEAWFSLIDQRRLNYAEPEVLRPFLDICIYAGVLPPLNSGYNIVWEDPRSMGQQEKAELSRKRAEALSYYFRYPTSPAYISFEQFLEKILGLSLEEIDEIASSLENGISLEQQMILDDLQAPQKAPAEDDADV